MKRLNWLLQAIFFYGFTWLVACIPCRLIDPIGASIGLLIGKVLRSRTRIAEEAIERSLAYMRTKPEWDCTLPTAGAIAREAFKNIGRTLVEACRLYHGKGQALIDQIELRGLEHFEAARAKGKGIIFLTGHCGNWELGALGFSKLCNVPVFVVARKQNNPYLTRMVERMREQYDNRTIYKDGALRAMLGIIRKNGTIGLLVDQAVIKSEGCLIQFLGRPAWASKTPVVMAQRTGVTVLPSFIHREGKHHVITFFPELQFSSDESEEGLRTNVQLYSSAIERFIIAHPDDWFWVHRRWKRA